jgi:hypothetical protein
MSTCQVTLLKLKIAKHSNLKSMYMPSLPTTEFKVSILFVGNNLIVKVYPTNYPAVITGRSRMWPDSEKMTGYPAGAEAELLCNPTSFR